MQIALIYEKYSQILDICKIYGESNKKEDGYGGVVGHVLHLKNEYLLVPCVGCMHMHNTLHCLHTKYGVDMFIRLGTCGAINREIELESTVLVSRSVNKDALSEKYFRDVKPMANERLLSYFQEQLHLPTRDAYTIDVAWEKVKTDVDLVDMETSALYSYANKNELMAISISIVRDNKNRRIKNDILGTLIVDNTKKIIELLEASVKFL